MRIEFDVSQLGLCHIKAVLLDGWEDGWMGGWLEGGRWVDGYIGD